MKLSHFLWGLTLLLIQVPLRAQTPKSFEIGFNVTNVIQNTIGLAGNLADRTEPYTMVMRYGNDKSAFRLALGGGYASDNDQRFVTGILDQVGYNTSLAFGYEIRQQVLPKLRYFYGAEGVFHLTGETNTFTTFDPFGVQGTTTKSSAKDYSLVPFFGIHFQVNKWMAISTKSRIELTISEINEQTIDLNTGNVMGPNYRVNYHIRHALPNTVFLYFNLSEIKNLRTNGS